MLMAFSAAGAVGASADDAAASARAASGSTATVVAVVDPTNHGSNLPVVAALALGIFVLIGLIVVLITRRGGRGRRR